MLKYAILLVVDLVIFKYIGFIPGLIGLAIIAYRVSDAIGFTRSIKFYRGAFVEGTVYTKDYTGSYKNIGSKFEEVQKILERFKLEKAYSLISIYYDCPGKSDVPEDKHRACIGIYKKKTSDFIHSNEEFEKYVLENGYKKNTIPSSSSLFSDWYFVNSFSLMYGIKKFYNELGTSFTDPQFKKDYKLKGDNIKVSVELYETKDTVKFYIPTVNEEKFMIHDSFPKTPAEPAESQ